MARDTRVGDWRILAAAFSILMVIYSVWYSFTVFLVAMGKDLGWSRSELSGAFSAFVITQSLVAPLAGLLADRLSPRLILQSGALIVALGLVFASRATQVWEFYASFGIVAAIGMGAGGFTPIVSEMTKRFKQDLGLALGIATAGIGSGIFVVVPLCQYFIITYGWRTAYVLLAVIVLVVCGSASVLFKGTPVGQIIAAISTPNGTEVAAVKQHNSSDSTDMQNDRDWSVATVLRTTKFWLFFCAFFAIVFGTQLVMVHQVAYLVDIGYAEMLAASVVGLIGLISIPAKVAWGIASDRFGRELSFTVGSVFVVMAVVLLLLLSSAGTPVWVAYLEAAIFGIGYAITAPLPPAITADLFPGKNLGSIWGVMYLAAGLAAAVGPFLAGYVFDVAGNYLAAFYLSIAFAAIGAIVIWMVAPSAAHAVRIGSKSTVQEG